MLINQEIIKIVIAILKYPGSPAYEIWAAETISRTTSAVDNKALNHAK